MANIIEYNGPSNPQLQPSDMGERALVQSARATHQFGDEQAAKIKQGFGALAGAADTIVKQYQHTDVTNALSQFATANNQLHDASSAFLKDPNLDVSDPSLSDKFMQTAYEPAMQKIRDGIKTQAGMDAFNEHYNQFSVQFRQQFQHDLGAMAGIHANAASNNYINQQSQLIEKNPAALVPAMATLESSLKSMVQSSPNISGPEAAKLQDTLFQQAKVKYQETALGSLMLKDPGAAKAALDAGEFPDVDGLRANMAIKQADGLLKQSANEGRAAQNFQREQQDRSDMAKFFREGGQLDASTGRFVTNPGYVMNMLKSVGQPGGVSAQVAHQAIMFSQKPDDGVSGTGQLHSTLTGLMDGTLTERQVIDKIGQPGGLSKSDASFALSINSRADGGDKLMLSSTMKDAEANLNPVNERTGFLADPMNANKVTKFTSFMQQKLDEGQKAGLSIRSILDPNSQNYFMKGMSWQDPRFQSSLSDQVQGALPGGNNAAVMQGARAASSSSGGSFVDRIQNLGERSHDGDVSSAGAEGKMQTLSSTQASPGFGVAPAADNSMAEKNRVGRDYAKAMLDHFSGSETLAAAAYNAGPQRVHQWMTQIGDPRKGEITDAQFAAAIPDKETRDYVQRVTGGGPPISSAERARQIMFGDK